MAVPNIFGSATSAIPLSQLDTNFATAITLGNTAVYLGNTTTSLGNVTLTNVTVSSGNVTVTGANVSGNLTFTGTGNRITGDFSNATIANRVALQSSTVDGATQLNFVPNGTATTAGIFFRNSSSTVDGGQFLVRILSTEAQLSSTNYGAGTTLPMTFYTGGSERARIDTSGNVGIGTSSPVNRLTVGGDGASLVNSYATYLANSYFDGAWKYVGNGVAWGIGNNFSGVTNGVTIAVAAVNSGGAAAALTWNPAFNIDSSGNVGIGTSSPACALDVVGGIQTSRTAVTSPAATDGNVFSGTYTPTLSNTTNIASSTAAVCQYMRVGNVVTVGGTVTIDPTATGRIVMGMTLPIASNFAGANECGGTFASSGTTTVNVGSIAADSTNDRATFDGVTADAASRVYAFSFTYRVI